MWLPPWMSQYSLSQTTFYSKYFAFLTKQADSSACQELLSFIIWPSILMRVLHIFHMAHGIHECRLQGSMLLYCSLTCCSCIPPRSQFVSKRFFELSWIHRECIDFVKWPREPSSAMCRKAILHLSSPGKLTSLRLRSFTHTTQTVLVPHVCRRLTRLHTLAINKGASTAHRARFVSEALGSLSATLTYLDIQFASIDDAGLSDVSRYLSKLKMLNLGNCTQISDAGVSTLGDCASLETLILDGTPISGSN
jgi:hypothetical protein